MAIIQNYSKRKITNSKGISTNMQRGLGMLTLNFYNYEYSIVKEEDKREQIVLNNISDSVKHCVKAYRKAFDIYSSIGDHVGATRMALEIASVQTHVLIRDYFHEAPVDILFSGCNNNSTKDNEKNNNNTLQKKQF